MLISISDIYSYVQENVQLSHRNTRPLEQGEQFYLAGQVRQVRKCGFKGQNVKARFIASKTTAEHHRIIIVFGDYSDYKQWKCSCSCEASEDGKCNHIVATLLYIYNAKSLGPIASTNVKLAQARRKWREIEAVPISQLCHFKKPIKPVVELPDSVREEIFMKLIEGCPDSLLAVHYKRGKGLM